MRVAMLSWEYPPLVVGGMAAAVKGLAEAVARTGHDVVVVTMAHPDAPAEEVMFPGGGRLRVLRASTDLPWLPDDNFLGRMASANHQLVGRTAGLGGWQADVVHSHDWLTSWAGDTLRQLWDAPLVATMHATERGRNGGVIHAGQPAAVNAVEWWLTYQAREVICCSSFMVNEVIDSFALPPAKVHRIPNGVRTADWAPPADAPRRGADGGPLLLAWGRIQYEKGFQTLLGALARLRHEVPGVQAVIAGRGSYGPELQDLAYRLGVDDLVRFAGFVPDAELVDLLHRATVAVIPSLYEPFGLVALEALAAEAPLVASAAGGLVEVLDGTGAAELFPPGDVGGLVAAVTRVLDPVVATSHQLKGVELVRERYTWDAVAAATLPVYQRAFTVR